MTLRVPNRWVGALLAALVLTAGVSQLGCGGCQGGGQEGFTVLIDAKPKGLDPRFATSDASAKLIGLLHSGLVSVDTADGEPELDLAESIDQPTPTRYEVTLRDDISFHDGEPVQAADVKYTLTQLDSDIVQSPYAQTDRLIASFEIHDPRHFTIELTEPHAPFLGKLAMGIVPKHRCAGKSECPSPPIGAGPFKFDSQDGNHRYVFRPFADYHGGKPYIDKLVFKVVQDDNTRLLALLGKSAELVQNAVSPLMLPVVRETKGLEVRTGESFKYTYLGFNLNHDTLEHRGVRAAIAYGIDRKAIVNYKFRGHATLSSGLLAPGHWAYEPDVPRYGYNPDKARRLLDKAGFPKRDGAPRFKLEFKVSASKFRRSIAELIAHQLGRIGIDVDVRSYEWGTFFSDIKSGNFEITTLQWPSVMDPSLYTWIFHSKNIPSAENRSAGANRGAYRNPEIDRLLDAGERETDRQQRKAIYSEVQKILARELPYVSLWHEHNIAILREGVEDYYMTPNARFEALKQTKPPDYADD
jgi:peptide/nickel transport system substrate-binding protein